jgi:hypothetical protein
MPSFSVVASDGSVPRADTYRQAMVLKLRLGGRIETQQ